MRNRLALAGVLCLSVISLHASVSDERYWAQWRGPATTGVSRTANPPLEWSETKNIRWKVEIPGRGSASPVVWGDRVFVLTAVPAGVTGDAQHAPARGVAAARGASVHGAGARSQDGQDGLGAGAAGEEEPHEASHHDNGTWASGSAITDGEHVFAYFESFGLYAYDMNGKLLWEKDLGDKKMRNEFGEGSTPALHGNTLVVVWDHLGGQSFVVALDKRDRQGTVARRAGDRHLGHAARRRDERARAGHRAGDEARAQLRPRDRQGGLGEGRPDDEPDPVAGVRRRHGVPDERLPRQQSEGDQLADAKGDIDGTGAIVWTLDRDTPYVPSPLLYDGVLYFLKTNNGLLSAFDAASGKPHYQNQRLEGVPNVFASPVGADGRVYFPGREGTTIVIKHGPTYEVLAKNTLDDGFDASPALVDNEIFLRGYRFLYSIEQVQ